MFAYVDDTYMIVVSDSWERNNGLLQDAHGHPLEWAKAYTESYIIRNEIHIEFLKACMIRLATSTRARLYGTEV